MEHREREPLAEEAGRSPDETGRTPDRSGAPDPLFEATYQELRAIARRCLARERSGHTLQPTALVNEAYLKLRNQREFEPLDRAEFMARAAGAMRLVLIDSARRRRAAKRDSKRVDLTLGGLDVPGATIPLEECIVLHEALDRLAAQRPNGERQALLIQHVWFGGLSFAESATRLGISRRQAHRDWAWARVWLRAELGV